MRILVIGGTAFIGPHVVTRLRATHHTVALFHRGQTEAALPRDVTHIHGERHRLADFARVFRRFDPEVVLDMIPTAQYEAQAVMSIFMGIARRVVAISSIDVYRAYGRLHGTEPGPVEPVPLTEDAPLRQVLYPYRGKSEEALDPAEGAKPSVDRDDHARDKTGSRATQPDEGAHEIRGLAETARRGVRDDSLASRRQRPILFEQQSAVLLAKEEAGRDGIDAEVRTV